MSTNDIYLDLYTLYYLKIPLDLWDGFEQLLCVLHKVELEGFQINYS